MCALLNPTDQILIPSPGYPAYAGIARFIGAEPIFYPVGREQGLAPTAEAIDAKCTDQTRAVILNLPSNPFGTLVDSEALSDIAEVVQANDLVVISDEIYRDLYYRAEAPPSICALTERSLFVSGLSKQCAMTGLRLGWVVGGADFCSRAALGNQLMVTCAPRFAQLAALEVFSAPEVLRAHVPHYVRAREAALEAARALPEDAPLTLGDGAFYAIVDVDAYAKGDVLAFALRLLDEEDLVVVPGTAFGADGSWFIRLSYSSGAENIREGLGRLARFLASTR